MPIQAAIASHIQVGDTVALTEDFIGRHGMNKESMSHARGKVTAIHRMADGTVLADLSWDKAGISKRLNVKSLVLSAR